MSLRRLNRLAKLNHLSEFSLDKLITDFGMYESALIDLRPIVIMEDDEPRMEVSQDIKALHDFLLLRNPLMIPCPDCKNNIPFKPKEWGNPRNLENTVPIKETKKKNDTMVIPLQSLGYDGDNRFTKNVFEVTKPYYSFGKNDLVLFNKNDIEYIKKPKMKNWLFNECMRVCKDYFLKYMLEVRRDYECSYDITHTIFVNFRIYDPIHPEDIEEYGNQLIEGENEFTQAYEFLQNCLIIQKIGQYPSLADLQMFDVEKYRSILGKDGYRDLTRAIGLYADGIGAGAFLYLRRIIEKLVEEAHQEEYKKTGWDDEAYSKERFIERIRILESSGHIIIPEQLKDVKDKIYGVLSKGVHENTDDECMELFPYMQFVIEQILDERIRKKELNDKINKLKKKLN